MIVALGLLLVLPGALASRWFDLDDAVAEGRSGARASRSRSRCSRGSLVVAVTRAPFGVAHGWASLGLATAVAAGLRFGAAPILRVLNGFGGFFNSMFSVFSNRDFARLMGVQFLAQTAEGVIAGSIAKSIAFGGQEGFDVTTVPSADYLLKVVLALYVPVHVHLAVHRRVHRPVRAPPGALVVQRRDGGGGAVVAAGAMLPLGTDTTEGKIGVHGRADRRDARRAGLRADRRSR